MSLCKCRIEALQPDAGVVGGELTVDPGLDSVPGRWRPGTSGDMPHFRLHGNGA